MLQFLQHLFKGSTKPDANWQPLQRPPAEQRAYAQWVAERTYLNWLHPYFKAYHYSKAGLPPCHGGLRVQRLDAACGQHGAVLLFDPSIGAVNFRHLFDLIRDRTISLGYHLGASDVRTRQHPRYQETIAKHFLKPNPHDCPETGRCQQRFGTVSIDLISLNDKPGLIRLVCTPIQNEMFCPAFSFDEFMNAVFNVEEAPPAASS